MALTLNTLHIAVVDAHRLPQRPKYNKGTRICRPLIVKLAIWRDIA